MSLCSNFTPIYSNLPTKLIQKCQNTENFTQKLRRKKTYTNAVCDVCDIWQVCLLPGWVHMLQCQCFRSVSEQWSKEALSEVCYRQYSSNRGFSGVYQNLVYIKNENLVCISKGIGCSQEKVLVLFQDSEIFVFTGDGFSLNSGFTKIWCTPEKPLLEVQVQVKCTIAVIHEVQKLQVKCTITIIQVQVKCTIAVIHEVQVQVKCTRAVIHEVQVQVKCSGHKCSSEATREVHQLQLKFTTTCQFMSSSNLFPRQSWTWGPVGAADHPELDRGSYQSNQSMNFWL